MNNKNCSAVHQNYTAAAFSHLPVQLYNGDKTSIQQDNVNFDKTI